MHDEVIGWLREAKRRYPGRWRGPVLEVGSYDLNGSARDLFPGDVEYVGVDRREGRGVDVVALASEAPARPGGWQVVVSTEMLEHDHDWRGSVRRMVEVVADGGLIVVTCAGPARKAHEVECGHENHYQNVCADELRFEVERALADLRREAVEVVSEQIRHQQDTRLRVVMAGGA